MKTLRDYDAALAVIKRVVAEWDPYRLLENGAPNDEFEDEIAKLVTYVPLIRSPREAAAAVSSAFSAAFEPSLFTPETCSEVGARLYAQLAKAGIAQS